MTDPTLVKDVMTARVATVRPDHPLQSVVDAFERHPFHHLPVVGESGKVVGIVSDRDVLREALSGKWKPERPVSAVMTAMVANIPPDATLAEACARLQKLGVNSLLVTEDGKLRGILTTRDLLKAFAPQ
jgi:acetoin utilization protein AcuB